MRGRDRSTGLSASLGIAEYVTGLLADAGLRLAGRPGTGPAGHAVHRPGRDPAVSGRRTDRRRSEYGTIVCHCERVTRGEIRDALASRLPPADTDALRRRTRVLNGRCQGFYCAAAVTALLASAGPGGSLPGLARSRDERGRAHRGTRPAGLAAAVELRRLGAGRVLVADRDEAAGGIPRHSAHTGSAPGICAGC